MMVTVYPTCDAALNISHPGYGKLRAAGSEWPLDGFTSRMLSDDALTTTAPSSQEAAAEPAPSKSKP